MDWAGALSAVATAVGIAKDLREIDQSLDNAGMKARLADVISNLADVRMALVDARDEAIEKDREIDRLREAFYWRGNLVEVNGFKYESFEDGSPRGSAFCPRCEQNAGRFYRMGFVVGGAHKCPECKTDYMRVREFIWDRKLI
ncbi:hypothetical protein [Mesorhizobium marinum]|uniref:Uncharacterized protein n=1 Tax=Mesorhizobium marinum TaxID=3228790 RepID=A0ABV3R125_9HYPH